MSDRSGKSVPAFGFLTVVEHDELGLFGGYLLLNAAARPLEFHCTAPISPNRTQEILYGATLKPYLYGEQIGQALLAKGKVAPLVVCTDMQPILAARDFTDLPLLLVQAKAGEGHGQDARATDGIAASLPATTTFFALSSNRVAAARAYGEDQDRAVLAWQAAHLDGFDLLEPFERIREALLEAQKGARAA